MLNQNEITILGKLLNTDKMILSEQTQAELQSIYNTELEKAIIEENQLAAKSTLLDSKFPILEDYQC